MGEVKIRIWRPPRLFLGKYKAFGGKISALAWRKKTLNPSAQYLKIQWKIPFSIFWLLLVKTPQRNFYSRNMDLLISKLLSKSFLDFGNQSNWKYANTYLHISSLTTSQSLKLILKQFWNQKVHISTVKKNLERFDQQHKKLKIGIPIVFSNLSRKGLGFFFTLEWYFFTNCIIFTY